MYFEKRGLGNDYDVLENVKFKTDKAKKDRKRLYRAKRQQKRGTK